MSGKGWECPYGHHHDWSEVVCNEQEEHVLRPMTWQEEAVQNVIDAYARTEGYDEKPSNPKDLIGTDKLPLGLVPGSALAYQALGHLEGNLKYGLVNWREAGVRTSIYIDALLRHTLKFVNGEWEDPVTHVPHLGSMGACINIIIDAYECGKLVDDRPKQAPVAEVIDRLSDVVKHLRELYKDKHPHHWTIEHAPTASGPPVSQSSQ